MNNRELEQMYVYIQQYSSLVKLRESDKDAYQALRSRNNIAVRKSRAKKRQKVYIKRQVTLQYLLKLKEEEKRRAAYDSLKLNRNLRQCSTTLTLTVLWPIDHGR